MQLRPPTCAAFLILAITSTAAVRDLQSPQPVADTTAQPTTPNVRIDVDLSNTHPVASNLYGIFFEEVQAHPQDLLAFHALIGT